MEALYRREQDRFIPGEATGSPWSARGQHGGPPSALLARAIETWNEDPELLPVRLTVDLFRQIPMAPLAVQVKPVRHGRRLVVLRASLYGKDREVCRATALLLRRSPTPPFEDRAERPAGPDGLTTESLLPPEQQRRVPPGFHTSVEVRRLPARGGLSAAWFRVPMPLVDGEVMTPFQRAAALSDFCNSLARTSGPSGEERGAFINTDTTLHLSRPAVGEWVCLEVQHVAEEEGIGLVEVVESDVRGRFGCCCQGRLAQAAYPLSPGDA